MSLINKYEGTYNKNKIFNSVLTMEDYRTMNKNIYKQYQIQDKVICFFNGRHWNVINFSTMLAYPVLYFKYWSNKHNETYINSLVVCPFTIRSIIYKGKIRIIDIVNYVLVLKNLDTGDEFFMDNPYTGKYDDDKKEKKIKSHVNRHEVKISILRHIYMFTTDLKYIDVKINDKKSIINKKYYHNKLDPIGQPLHNTYHPKTLVYVIQYYSHNIKQYKYYVIIGNNINKDTITGYNYKNTQLLKYLDTNKQIIINKKAYIYPILWYMVGILYKNAEIFIM